MHEGAVHDTRAHPRFVHPRIVSSLDFPHLLARLASAVQQPLPGAEAQARMAPRPRGGWPSGFDAARLRHAAGLVLVYPINDDPHIVLTVRSPQVRHAGQVSLPGGVIEPGESAEHAALRETEEEIACAIDPVRVLGQLTPLDIPVSGFRLHPVLASIDQRPVLTPSDAEVARILEVPVRTLASPQVLTRTSMQRGTITLDVPAFETHGVTIWGATAMVLAEFLTLAGWSGYNWPG